MKEALSVIGLGKLGLCTAACFAKAGYHVLGMDIREDHVESLRNGETPFHETGLQQILLETKQKLSFTTSIATAIANTDITFIIVPTPSKPDGSFDNSFLISVLQELGSLLAGKKSFHIVNIVSTVMPGSCQNVFVPLLEELSGKRAGIDFGLAYNPEFIAIGSVIKDFTNPDLVLIGESDRETGKKLQEIYQNTCANHPHISRTNHINAEIAKLALNCYCTMKISFANNIGNLCHKLPQSDPHEICQIIGQDSRVGHKYIQPGLGFGGPCFPRDNEAFIAFSKKLGGYNNLQQAVIDINNSQLTFAVEQIIAASKKHGSTIALLGLAYKTDTYLTERSQALDIALALSEQAPDLNIKVFDPLATHKGSWQTTKSIKECTAGANIAAILTPYHNFFKKTWQENMANNSVIINFWN